MILIIPGEIVDDMDKRLDKAISECKGSEVDREYLRNELLLFYEEHGYVPDFEIKKKEEL